MVVQLPTGSTALDAAVAATVLALHITAGGVALVAGTVALVANKGSLVHRRAGHWFFVAMLTMSTIGACAAMLLPQRISIVAGALAFYLVATGWATVRRRPGTGGRFEAMACIGGLGVAVIGILFGWQAVSSPNGRLDGQTCEPAFIFAAIAALGAAGDLRVYLRGGIVGGRRIARHLWRLCTAFLLAALSFFLGQEQVFPHAVRGSFLLFVPELAIIASMAYWLVRTRWPKRRAIIA
jgi:hypothetical protein